MIKFVKTLLLVRIQSGLTQIATSIAILMSFQTIPINYVLTFPRFYGKISILSNFTFKVTLERTAITHIIRRLRRRSLRLPKKIEKRAQGGHSKK